MSVTKKIRFEVFKRDGFQCGYCGQSPPVVVLEVDHINPKSKGGLDDMNNLITACFDCNHGKKNIPLDQIPTPLKENFEIIKERELQLREYNFYLSQIEDRIIKDIGEIDELYTSFYPAWMLSDRFKATTIRLFLSKLSKYELLDAIRKAGAKFPNSESEYDAETAIKYFCGVCWKKIKGTVRPQ